MDMSTIDWKGVCHLEDVNDMVGQCNDRLVRLFNVHAPFWTVHVTQRQYLWITYNVKQLMKRRDEGHTAARTNGNDSQNKDLKKVVNDALVSENKAYYNYYVNKQKDYRLLWAYIKKYIYKSKPKLPTHVFNDPNFINNYFLNVPNSIQSSLSDMTYVR